tara:strand:- start:324 stop:545 length:222 start_codon:yes stop_codon:yes gene_type:complete
MNISDIFKNEDQTRYSIKRVHGSLLIVSGLIGKMVTWWLVHTRFDKIDSSCDVLIGMGIILIGGSIVDKFTKK